MFHSFVKNIKTVRCSNAVAAGTTEIDGDWVDTLGFTAVQFEAHFGALTATQVTSFKLQYSDNGTDSIGDVTGAASANLADGDSNKIIQIELHKPTHRYVRGVVVRGTANAVLSSMVAHLYKAGFTPFTASTTVKESVSKNAPAYS